MSVITVQGLVQADPLGIVAPHEHILIDLRNQFREFAEVARRVISEQKVGIGNIDILRAEALKALIEAGYLEQILLSTEICHKNLLHHYGGWGYDHILTNLIAMLGEKGVSDQQINVLLKDNPHNFLDIGG